MDWKAFETTEHYRRERLRAKYGVDTDAALDLAIRAHALEVEREGLELEQQRLKRVLDRGRSDA